MIKNIISILLCFVWLTATHRAAAQGYYFARPAAGGGLAAFSDNFDRANSTTLGANWTEDDPDLDIFSNTLRIVDGGFAQTYAFHTTSCSTVNQYGQIEIAAEGGFPTMAFRYVNSSTEFYFMSFGAITVNWNHAASLAGAQTQINAASGTIAMSAGTILSVTITGTGNSTVVRVWDDVPSGTTPTSASSWNGDTTPDATFTDDPGNPVDTGFLIGIGGAQNTGNTERFDDFFGGDIP